MFGCTGGFFFALFSVFRLLKQSGVIMSEAMQKHRNRQSRMFAIGAHGLQQYGNLPYLVHLDQVVQVLHDTLPPTLLTGEVVDAAWTHDTLEDTDTTYDELEREFGTRVADAVFAITGYGHTRETRWASAKRNSKQVFAKDYEAFLIAALVKVADRTVNLRNSFLGKPDLFAAYLTDREAFHQTYVRYVPTDLRLALEEAYALAEQQTAQAA